MSALQNSAVWPRTRSLGREPRFGKINSFAVIHIHNSVRINLPLASRQYYVIRMGY